MFPLSSHLVFLNVACIIFGPFFYQKLQLFLRLPISIKEGHSPLRSDNNSILHYTTIPERWQLFDSHDYEFRQNWKNCHKDGV